MTRLYVYVFRAKDLPVRNVHVKLQVGKHKLKTRTFRKTDNINCDHVWNEEFVFKVHGDDHEELVLSVFDHDSDSGLLFGSGEIVGRVRIPVRKVVDEDNHTLPPTWFCLQKEKSGKFVNVDCGKILVSLSLQDSHKNRFPYANSKVNDEDCAENEIPFQSSHGTFCSKAPCFNIMEGKKLMKVIASRLERIFNKNDEGSKTDDSSELASAPSDYEDCVEEHPSSVSFDEAIETMNSSHHEQRMPEELQGGILLDKIYVISSFDLNTFLFAPNSQFRKEIAELEGTTELHEQPWTWKSVEPFSLTRTVTYKKAATKLVKAVKATEEQTYLRAKDQEFAILVTVSTPEVPYGNTFNVELLYKIVPCPEMSSREQCSRLIISWGVAFHQTTMMKGMIEGGVRQGLKESFDHFAELLAQNLNTPDTLDLSDKDHLLASLEAEHQSDWDLAVRYFCNFTVVSTILMALYVFVHILLCDSKSKTVQGLEFNGIDLPDSFGQLFTTAVLVIHLEKFYNMVSHFIQARVQRGSDHGVRAQGTGWVLTVALVEGTNLVSFDSTRLSDPYVVFYCNGKTRTSSVKLQTSDPQWNDILEFDAMEEPPSVLDVEVFDFDGPFDQATSLGHAEINFLKHSSTELADLWVPLDGKLSQSSLSKLHLRIFLDNSKGVETIKEYLTKKEKEVGKKLNLQSPHKNSAFQKLFGLPPEEFLINDFTCQLRRKIPIQGRLFLSARIVGFYSNLFGHKTKFFFLWEDIEDINELPPSLSSVGSPSLVIVLREGRGLDAKHWAKSQDDEGRLKFYLQSFVSFNVASRTIMALWKTRALTPEQNVGMLEEEQQEDEEERPVTVEDSGLGLAFVNEDSKLSKIYSAELPISIESLMGMLDGGYMEHKIMERSGCLNYTATAWEPTNSGDFERYVSYRFSRHVSIFGGEVACTQRKSPIPNDGGWIINEVMVLHDVPFADHFHVNFRYHIKKSSLAGNACKCEVYAGITWLKSTMFQQRIRRNIIEKFTDRIKEITELVERESLFAVQPDNSI